MNTSTFVARRALVALGFLAAACSAQAQISIDQNKALAGSVTPGDTPGFPVVLSVSGAYKLTGNLVVPASTDGVFVAAPNITIDLNGFSIVGPVVCSGSAAALACAGAKEGSGIGGYSGMHGATVRNGTVRGFGAQGVSLDRGATIERVTAISNAGYGFALYDNGSISNSMASDNGADGMLLQSGGTIVNSRAHNNKGTGFTSNSYDSGENREMGGEVRDSYASRNGALGFQSYGTPVSWIGNTAVMNAGCFNQAGKKVRNNVCNGVAN
ncbi:MAG: right-handed parallel beta-helix repeat-containing protein [Hyphomicrobium sp.]|nr:right-handed parallel beta-helix repeat-containing protein [Hyphomicrobium sp.]